jgi:H+/Cl- antiporter ClcA
MRVNVSDASYKMLLIASVSAAFGTAFNLPLTGVLFGMEVLFISHIDYEACIPCLISTATAMWSSNFIQQYVPTDRTTYNTPSITGGTFTHIDILILAQVTGASLIFGVVAAIFAALTHKLRHIFTYICNRHTTIRPVLGGIIIAALFAACGALSLTPESYVGLGETSYKPGVVSIQSSFSAAGAEPYSWILKLIFTSVSIGSGFKGGEVTPLLFIGAALGNFMARYIFFSAHVDLFAAMGFSAVFGAASNTPLTSTILGIEMFGSGTIAIYFAASCFGAYITSGFCGIFYSQLGKSSAKFGGDEIKPTALFNIHENKLILNYRRLW